MSLFETLKMQPDDPILGLSRLFNEDPRKEKISVAIGVYQNDEGKSVVLNSVSKAEQTLLEKKLNKEYLPIDGDKSFCKETSKLLFGENSSMYEDGNVYVAQTIGASGALRVGAEFLKSLGINRVFVSSPTWSNHMTLFASAGFTIGSYPYYNSEEHCLDFDRMCECLRNAPKRSVILLHSACHNPTGVDPTDDQWKELSQILKKQALIPFIDMAYQGFKKDVNEDAFAIRQFLKDGHEFFVTNSYSKNFGLYGERVGALSLVTYDKQKTEVVASHVKNIIRASYSSPPLQGARIVSTVLSNPQLKAEWLEELRVMRNRVIGMRKALVEQLEAKGTGDRFNFIKNQSGLFTLMGLSEQQVLRLRKEYAIFMPTSGRINVAGLNKTNIEPFVEALLDIL